MILPCALAVPGGTEEKIKGQTNVCPLKNLQFILIFHCSHKHTLVDHDYIIISYATTIKKRIIRKSWLQTIVGWITFEPKFLFFFLGGGGHAPSTTHVFAACIVLLAVLILGIVTGMSYRGWWWWWSRLCQPTGPAVRRPTIGPRRRRPRYDLRSNVLVSLCFECASCDRELDSLDSALHADFNKWNYSVLLVSRTDYKRWRGESLPIVWQQGHMFWEALGQAQSRGP